MNDRYAVLGPVACIACRRPVVWERVADLWFLQEVTDVGRRKHHCLTCGVVMPKGERCARRSGHRHEHRTSWDVQTRRERAIRERAAA